MANDLKKKAKIFWAKNKGKIISTFLGVATLCGLIYAADAYNKKCLQKEQEEAEEAKRKADEYMAEYEKMQAEWYADPLNNIAGGTIADYNDASIDKYTMAEFTINDVPIEKMGEFGQELLAISKERFPEMENLDLAQMIIELRKSSELKEEEENEDC